MGAVTLFEGISLALAATGALSSAEESRRAKSTASKSRERARKQEKKQGRTEIAQGRQQAERRQKQLRAFQTSGQSLLTGSGVRAGGSTLG